MGKNVGICIIGKFLVRTCIESVQVMTSGTGHESCYSLLGGRWFFLYGKLARIAMVSWFLRLPNVRWFSQRKLQSLNGHAQRTSFWFMDLTNTSSKRLVNLCSLWLVPSPIYWKKYYCSWIPWMCNAIESFCGPLHYDHRPVNQFEATAWAGWSKHGAYFSTWNRSTLRTLLRYPAQTYQISLTVGVWFLYLRDCVSHFGARRYAKVSSVDVMTRPVFEAA